MSAKWTIFTNHAHVLFCISEDPDTTLREVALRVGITERATQRIVAELEESGYLKHERRGRRNHYEVMTDVPLRHDIESHVSIGDIIQALHKDPAGPR
ncbi:MAG: winged helix-turn-helix domain-containing protein [Acidimicrobiia bacterium]|nr:winged helix-turn-helix domain-containing protein [Acidimicrobiia bacterium]